MSARCPLRLACVALCLAVAGCNFFEDGRWVPEDPGSVSALTRDERGSPLGGVLVEVEIPNDVGGVFYQGRLTGGDGRVTIGSVPSGRRPVSVRPPVGFTIPDDQRVQIVDVQHRRTATVAFILTRQ